MGPLISIIVPIYNIESHLKRCVDSILKQSLTNFEVILVNDGSSDDSGMICDEYAERDNRVKVIHKKNGGVSSSRNAGLRAACGQYIAFVDGDDWIQKDMYNVLYNLIIKTNSDISICKLGREIDGILINKDEKSIISEMSNEGAMRELFKGILYRFSLCNKLFRKECFIEVQFPEGRIHEDLSTTYKLFANASKVVFTNFIGYVYVKRENSIITSNFYEKRLDAFIGWNEILLYMKQNYPSLFEEAISCFAYSCIDNMHLILGQVDNVEVKQKYLGAIKQITMKYYKDIIRSNTLAIKSKFIVTLLNCNIQLLLALNNLKAFIRAKMKFRFIILLSVIYLTQ